jgi:hypothetical protein
MGENTLEESTEFLFSLRGLCLLAALGAGAYFTFYVDSLSWLPYHDWVHWAPEAVFFIAAAMLILGWTEMPKATAILGLAIPPLMGAIYLGELHNPYGGLEPPIYFILGSVLFMSAYYFGLWLQWRNQ